MTINVARQWRQESREGPIACGRLADTTGFDRDFLHDDLGKAFEAELVATIADGEEVYRAQRPTKAHASRRVGAPSSAGARDAWAPALELARAEGEWGHGVGLDARLWLTDHVRGERAPAWQASSSIFWLTDRGGFGYQSFIILKDGHQGTFGTHEFRCFRALAVKDGRACVIDSRTLTHYGDFVRALMRIGVTDAIYCDMGSGWNYSWYRDDDGRTETIMGMPWPFSHNWLTFRRDAA